jgi:NAD(P)-dependent dehydrogenase (short-subunit alcohol dehydrogenase family)
MRSPRGCGSNASRRVLDGGLALVTGAGRGIGRGCARALAEGGADIVAVSRSAGELDQLAEEVRALGGDARPVALDVTDSGAIRRLIDGLPRLDVLVVSAGTNVPEPLLEVADASLDLLLALNVRATFVTLQAAARRMVEAAEGSIVLISSQLGHVGASGRSAYCTTKHAVEGLTKAAALELAPHGVRVNSVAPTFVETPMTEPFLAEERFRAEVEARIPLGRLGRVEDVTGAVVYLASDASALVTGTSLLVDGGWTAQ